ncbi:MAG: hypothetical protein HZA05_01700 [Nitrospirae bacterium]|nr:hypothetical protein [Nitrospirota bacterium]
METKGKTKTKKIILQDRDHEMLRYVLEQKFMSREQVTRWFYKSFIQSQKRLRELILSGYLKKEPVALSSKDHFLITGLGLRVLAERGVNGIRPASSIDIRFYFHDRIVTDLRLLFESIGLARDWKSEKILRSELSSLKVPDGVFLSPADKKIAFELELTPKVTRLYGNILSGYQGVDNVFYVVRGGDLFGRLRRIVTGEGINTKTEMGKAEERESKRAAKNRDKILLCRLEDIEKDPLNAVVFWGYKTKTIKELIDAK